jgi:hypothetical protein
MGRQMREGVDTNQGIVKQNEFKKNYRAKHAKLAKAFPTPHYNKLYLGVLGVPFVVAQDMLCARYNFSQSFRPRKISNIFG